MATLKALKVTQTVAESPPRTEADFSDIELVTPPAKPKKEIIDVDREPPKKKVKVETFQHPSSASSDEEAGSSSLSNQNISFAVITPKFKGDQPKKSFSDMVDDTGATREAWLWLFIGRVVIEPHPDLPGSYRRLDRGKKFQVLYLNDNSMNGTGRNNSDISSKKLKENISAAISANNENDYKDLRSIGGVEVNMEHVWTYADTQMEMTGTSGSTVKSAVTDWKWTETKSAKYWHVQHSCTITPPAGVSLPIGEYLQVTHQRAIKFSRDLYLTYTVGNEAPVGTKLIVPPKYDGSYLWTNFAGYVQSADALQALKSSLDKKDQSKGENIGNRWSTRLVAQSKWGAMYNGFGGLTPKEYSHVSHRQRTDITQEMARKAASNNTNNTNTTH